MHGIRLFPLLALTLMAPAAAQAQFYDLDGQYRCVTAPDDACAKALGARPASPQETAKPKDEPAAPSLEEAIARVRKHAATAADLRLIESRAADREPHAVEALAWCKLNGIATAKDAVAAYWLYREAADLGVANARKNQIAIYETRLTSEERQKILMRENAQ